ncbi:MAG: ferritin-like domain-containing protein [Sphingomonadaceae bacterium]
MTITQNETDMNERRAFLRGAGLAAAGIGAFAAAGSPALAATKRATGRGKALAGSATDLDILQVALALEHEGIAAYTIAGGSGLLTPDVLKVALVFLGHHKGHRDSLAGLIQKAGGKPVESKSDAEYVSELNLGALKSQGDVVALATRLEMGAASAYVGQVAALKDHSLARLFAQLSSDEAVHWAILNNALGNPIPANAYLFG